MCRGDLSYQDLSSRGGKHIYHRDSVLLTLLYSKGFARDEHIPDLLLFSPQYQFHDDPTYKSGKIILQDKASCFPAVVLAPPTGEDSVVIDATAAPGNKTSHLSMLMCNKGKVCWLTLPLPALF
jgi:16S rRNA C967 or C1407 C5-methylase (RsmB/RsmF family)